jgi:hypothetical protein
MIELMKTFTFPFWARGVTAEAGTSPKLRTLGSPDLQPVVRDTRADGDPEAAPGFPGSTSPPLHVLDVRRQPEDAATVGLELRGDLLGQAIDANSLEVNDPPRPSCCRNPVVTNL